MKFIRALIWGTEYILKVLQDGSDCDDTLTVGDLMSLGHMMGRKFSHDDLQHILSQCSDEQDLLDFPDLLNKMQIMTDDLQPCSRSELKQAFKVCFWIKINLTHF